MEKIKEQFERIKRWHERFKEIHSGREHTRESDYYQDVVYAFFQNCWSLKDWIINSGALSKEKIEEVEKFFHSNMDMKICRDIANGSKHLLIKEPSIDPNISIARREYSLSLGGTPKIEVVYWIEAKDKEGRLITLNAFDLASTLVATSEGFLKKHNLLNYVMLPEIGGFGQIAEAARAQLAHEARQQIKLETKDADYLKLR